MIHWPNDLISDIARRRCVLYLGAGISANSINDNNETPPTWEKFLKLVLDQNGSELYGVKGVVGKLIKKKDFLLACEIILDKIGVNRFGDLVNNAFRRPGFKPCGVHEQIFKLDSRIIITPNVDKIYEDYARSESHSTCVVKTYNEPDIAKFLRSEDYLIIRAHGDIDNTDTLVFTHSQYNEVKHKHGSFYVLINALMLTHTFLFLGCGFNDPDIQLLLESVNFTFPSCNSHYFVCSEKTKIGVAQKTLLRNRNLSVLQYTMPRGSRENFLKSLEDLVTLVYERRRKLSENFSW